MSTHLSTHMVKQHLKHNKNSNFISFVEKVQDKKRNREKLIHNSQYQFSKKITLTLRVLEEGSSGAHKTHFRKQIFNAYAYCILTSV